MKSPNLALLLSLAVLGLSGCMEAVVAGSASIVPTKTPLPPGFIENNTYGCNGGKQFVASFEPEGTSAAITFDSRTRMLTRDASGVYKDSDTSLTYTDAGVITVSRNGVPMFENCTLVTNQRAYYGRTTRYRFWNPDKDLKLDY